ncbi:uncharacterized protein [Trachinotus anak]|uniref:uncharacterized protein n=1 Tax=Trachinotus anak TaxID=443729 RepID=UPI0039F19983
MLNLIMVLLWMILPVFLVCAEAENVTEVNAELGQNITLNCPQNISDLYWYMQIYGQLSGFIGRVYSGKHEPSYCSPNFKTKYFPQGNTLLITNITAEDFRLYFCAKKTNNHINYVGTFHLVLVSPDVPPPPSTNDSAPNQHQQPHNWTIWQSDHVRYGSLILNAVLILLMIGLVSTSLCVKGKSRDCKLNETSPVAYDRTETLEIPQYEEIQFSTSTVPTAAPECIYYKAQIPRSVLPQQ